MKDFKEVYTLGKALSDCGANGELLFGLGFTPRSIISGYRGRGDRLTKRGMANFGYTQEVVERLLRRYPQDEAELKEYYALPEE